jgi:hypothetical protein
MPDETKDPREAVLERAIRDAYTCGAHSDDLSQRPFVPRPPAVLARLDAADPLRQIWPEVVEALERACGIIETGNRRLMASDGPAGGQPPDISLREWRTMYVTLSRALTRAREIMEADDGE